MSAYLDAVALAPHYHALNMTTLSIEESNIADYPWHIVEHFVSPSFFFDRLSATCELQVSGFDQGSGLTFSWEFDIEDPDSADIDVKAAEHVLKSLGPVPQAEFKEHLRRTIRAIHDLGNVLIEDGKKEHADALILSQLVQP